ncbi:hypothetical protein H0X06_02640 [Candidatus Dependentiae bacterium]|nr:hypothetical protein [Candidatus Dependentiae bacterium]
MKGFKANDGFTLNELVCTLALVQLLILISVPLVFISKQPEVYRELRRLSAVMLYLKRKALIEKKSFTLTFFPERRSYKADCEHVLHPDVMFGTQEGVCGPPSNPKHALKQAITWEEKKIVFYPTDTLSDSLGKISSGAVYLTDKAKTCTYALTCDISYGTVIRCYRYDNGWKLVS